jgi:phosphoglycerate kinase
MADFTSYNFSGKKALIRVDFNVPLDENFNITDDSRIRGAIPTIKKILDDGGSVILMSHLGRPKEGPTEKFSLKHIIKDIQNLINQSTGKQINVLFAADCVGEEAIQKANSLKPGEVLLLENLRFYKEEEKGEEQFAEKLSKLGDVYVNDAFGTAHRAHASTAVIAKFFSAENRLFGLLMQSEIKSAERVIKSSEKPFTAIIGGAKVSDKILIIENLLQRATDIIIGGGMAYTFIKATDGKVGNSLVEDDRIETAKELLNKAQEADVCIHLAADSIIADKFAEDASISSALSSRIPDGWMGLDIGALACENFRKIILDSKTILWNGPMGVFEMEKFQHGTKAIAQAVAEATENGAYSLVGGGDSVAAVNQFGFADKISYISTGGGALLEYFEGKELPGIAAINQKA